MEIPEWLKTAPSDESRANSLRVTRYALHKGHTERFLDKTLRQIVSFIEETMFNESVSMKDGLLQRIEPRVKVISLLLLIVVLSFQKTVEGISSFSVLVILLVFASKVPFSSFLRKLLPAAAITIFISVPVLLNPIVNGDPLLILLRFERAMHVGPLVVPKEIAITRQGVNSAITLLLRVLTSVSFVFLMIMTTRPNTFMKALSSLVPGPLKSVVSINYRYIFFLVRKVEQYIMGLKSRQISVLKSTRGRHWVASRIGLLFSTSMELSDELSLAMESRGYKGTEVRSQKSEVRISNFSGRDMLWLLFTVFFCGVMIWKSLV